MHIVITGNIGCGKSTLTKMLANELFGYTVFDVDAEIHNLYSGDTPIAVAFRKAIFLQFGTSNRQELSDIVFADASARLVLERITKPFVSDLIEEVAVYYPNVIFDYPLYYEMDNGQLNSIRKTVTVAVHCDEVTQRRRIADRGRFTTAKTQAIIDSQFSADVKVALSDWVVDSNLSLDDMKNSAKLIAQHAQTEDLQYRFSLICDGASRVWPYINDQYGHSDRYYHSKSHLVQLFNQFDQIKDKLNNPDAVELAIWFHDYVYDTHGNYALNEASSAKALWEFQSAGDLTCVLSDVKLAVEMIMATKGHTINSAYLLSRPGSLSDCQHFLDMDLSGFGVPEEVSLRLDDKVREEFWHVDELQFATARIAALSTFIQRPKLYLTETFAHMEDQARSNIRVTIKRYEDILRDLS